MIRKRPWIAMLAAAVAALGVPWAWAVAMSGPWLWAMTMSLARQYLFEALPNWLEM